MTTLEKAVSQLLDSWDWHTLHDMGPHLTCDEADALFELLLFVERDDLAHALMEGHAGSDEDGDRHYEGKTK